MVVRLVIHLRNVQDVRKTCTQYISKKIIHSLALKDAQEVTLQVMRIENVFVVME
jgi:hypothetical protein